jgi:general nucleoside transport system ATP-binding protein
MEASIRTVNLTKKFHQVVANDAVSFDVLPGEIHCLLGENGAGKSTLAECLYGFYKPDKGQIFIDGKEVDISSPAEAIGYGIGMVHQHFVLVSSLSVLENIVVGTKSQGLLLDLRAAEKKIKSLCDYYNVELDLHAKVWQLPVGQQQWVEILKTLYVGAQILILDEPTAVLTPEESKMLFKILQLMTDDNMSVILISHKLNEVLQSDRVTILRKGKKVATVTTAESSKEELTSKMVGREINATLEKKPMKAGKHFLAIKNLKAKNDRGQEALKGFDLTVRTGEIVGIAGVAGNGQKELFETLIGVRKATEGEIYLNGVDIVNRDPKYIQKLGVAFIPEDRFAEGLVSDFTVEENLILGNHCDKKFKKNGFLNFKEILVFAKECINKFDIQTPSEKTLTRTLSGGNAQKVIVAREFAQNAQLTLANQPSRGLDVGVIEYMHQMLLKKRDEKGGILMASEDLEELFNIADTIVVMHDGQIMGSFPVAEADINTIGLLMAGHADQPGPSQQVDT